jgi:ParB-like chromosome segregation protein Spo0J
VRKLDPAHIDEVAGSISALGFCVPVLIGKDNHILDGGARLQAARLLGLGYAPCLRIDHLTDDEQRLLRLAVNRLGEKGQWNLDELKIEFEELILAGAPIEITGFELQEIDQIVLDGGGGSSRAHWRHRPAQSQSLISATCSNLASIALSAAARPTWKPSGG